MKTGAYKYNVIWVDDEVDQLHKDAERLLRKYGIKVIDVAHTAQEFHEKIKYKLDLVDAIITDANFGDKDVDLIKNENTLRGFTCVPMGFCEAMSYVPNRISAPPLASSTNIER